MTNDAARVDEPIEIVDYDPAWPALFVQESSRIRAALGDVVAGLEHFGSTAVRGMAGKPIVDILVGVRHYDTFSNHIPKLEAIGYENFGEIFIPERIYLRKRSEHKFNVAVTRIGGEFWQTQILLRDYLRTHPAEAEAYSASKRTAYENGARMFSSYSKSKLKFLAGLMERARRANDNERD